MRVLSVDVVPKRLKSGKYTLHEITRYDAVITTSTGLRMCKQRAVVWPPVKQPNGRGKAFATYAEATEYFVAHRDKTFLYGERTNRMLERYVAVGLEDGN